MLDYFDAGGTRRRMTLGRSGEMALAEARGGASRELAAIRDGGPDMAERRRKAIEAPTVVDLTTRFLSEEAPARMERGRMSKRTATDYGQQTRRYILPTLGNLKVAEVNRRHIEVMVKPLKPVQRNRVLALTSRLFTLAERWEWREQRTNPARGIERARETARDRVLSSDEMAALAGALNDVEADSPAAVAALRFLALTGLRVGEALAIQWEHLDLSSGRLLLPKTKTGRRLA